MSVRALRLLLLLVPLISLHLGGAVNLLQGIKLPTRGAVAPIVPIQLGDRHSLLERAAAVPRVTPLVFGRRQRGEARRPRLQCRLFPGNQNQSINQSITYLAPFRTRGPFKAVRKIQIYNLNPSPYTHTINCMIQITYFNNS